MQLSERMHRLSSWVTEGNRLADVGTDHGYIPIYLVREKKIPSAIAMDVNKGPLERAREHIHEYGLDTYIKTRLSDGLSGLLPGEADTVLIAGMGGALTVRILEGGAHCLDSIKELILQPQSEIRLVRSWLFSHGFRIETEDMVLEDNKYYPLMRAVHGETGPSCEWELYYGAVRAQQSPEVLLAFLLREAEKNQQIMEVLRQNGQEKSVRMDELLKKEARLQEALFAVRGRKDFFKQE